MTLQATKYILIGSKKCLNLATHNYLGFIGNEEIEKQTTKSLYKYGVGSSGPRGFYGTMGKILIFTFIRSFRIRFY